MVRLYQRLLRRIGLGRRTTPRHRAVAVVIDGERLLVIKRHKRGRDYAVLPGGGVERGETAAQVAVRELWEETTLTAEIDRPLWTGRHKDRPASYFLMSAVRGRARLSGPEARANRPDNSFLQGRHAARARMRPADHARSRTRDPLLVAGVDGCATVSGSTARARFGNAAGWAVWVSFRRRRRGGPVLAAGGRPGGPGS